ncbi:SDR family NAD(P)-dependent oxidoreductase [Paraburkholderia xenovorans]|uniref:SDR family NAD(P)-dependent oxidoreductase n=1 Tax=Paraburkholderia xenovorans TaxID=36873 RepID=UPI00155952A8|nr:SDR family oxidoreductase [Paraburkholderia xenovorans]NPT38505.1 SDR family oxidoreductase [Paraburkholderia xenovorans]
MVAIVTGAGSGLGKAVAQRFIEQGKTVALLDRSTAGLQEMLIRQGTGKVSAYAVDVSDEASVESVFAKLREELGAASILVNSAGIADMRPALEMPGDAWNRVMAVNVSGSLYCAKAAARQMIESGYGRIVNFASVSGLRASFGRVAYGTSKAAVISLTTHLAVEWAQYGITVNAIAPGPIETPMSASLSGAAKEAYLARIPAGRYGKPAEIVAAVEYLTGSGAGFVTGHTLVVDGGFTVFGTPAF